MTTDPHPGQYAATMREVDGQPALVLVPLPPAGVTGALAEAWERRTEANLTGVCACGARADWPNRAERRAAARERRVMHATMAHEHDCSATDEAIARLTAASLS